MEIERSYKHLSKILKSEKSDQLKFLKDIIEILFDNYDELPEDYESQFSKAVIYLIC